MELRSINQTRAGDVDDDERRERSKFRRLKDEAESFQVLHLAVAEALFRERGETLTADTVRAILARLGSMGYELRRSN